MVAETHGTQRESIAGRLRRSRAASAFLEATPAGAWIHRAVRAIQPRRSMPFTRFQRSPAQLEVLVRHVLPALRKDAGRGATVQPVRIVVWGCSNGAEAYTIASTVLHRLPGLPFAVEAYDIDESALATARAGVYSLQDVSGDPRFVAETFHASGPHLRVRPQVAATVSFARRDILGSAPTDSTPADVVFAQNMLFHFGTRAASHAFANLQRFLAPGSALFVDGMDLDVRTRLSRACHLEPCTCMLEEIHADGARTRGKAWPFRYWGLEPLSKSRADWRRRYCTIFLRPAGGPAGCE